MKILLTGGGSGGHFYPLMAVAQQIRKSAEEKKLLQPRIYYAAPEPYDKELLFKLDVKFKKVSSGKIRRYFSLLNFSDFFKTGIAVMKGFFTVFSIFPDVVYSNGGFASFPILFAARFFRIPVVIHISDTVPGKVNKWATKFAKKISLGFPEASEYFPSKNPVFTGNPVRNGLTVPLTEGAHEFLKLDKEIPTILILGGSHGSKNINDIVVDVLPELLEKYQVIHQTGKDNFEEVVGRSGLVLENSPYKDRYKLFKFVELLALRMSVGASDMIISRAGAGTISEISIWGLPSILIPIEDSMGDHQKKNAFAYARYGGSVVIEEKNLTPNLFVTEIKRIMDDATRREEMSKASKQFSHPEAAKTTADEILDIALKHEK